MGFGFAEWRPLQPCPCFPRPAGRHSDLRGCYEFIRGVSTVILTRFFYVQQSTGNLGRAFRDVRKRAGPLAASFRHLPKRAGTAAGWLPKLAQGAGNATAWLPHLPKGAGTSAATFPDVRKRPGKSACALPDVATGAPNIVRRRQTRETAETKR